ncbi:flavin reductase family protein [Gordonia rubripertincta]|uniref:flavin reductase family protein n=1 Tax=Gordonia rubripertincta TaxID=36822 RepID=UPI001180593F|nr:flavin reductase family protein [Gordonia rubripertincta]QMU23099.1 flavin reductase family protein [Gordonia rubripertincta]TSD98279.1 flavin reductase family protein [Gordonia rubripertincta]
MSIEAMSQTDMRKALGQFASGVTVVTGLDDSGPAGFVCQSFASVSLEPPMVLFCADHRGRSWPRILRAGRFTVNVLHENQADICSRFGSRDGRKFDGLDWELSDWSTPSLPDVLMRVHADIHDVHTAGDHDVVIGRVLELETPNEERPLLFFRGKLGIDSPADRLTA